MPDYSSFVVRVWTDEKRGVLRGQIQHVGSEQMIRFVHVEDVVPFILSQTAVERSRADQGNQTRAAENDGGS